MISFLNLWITSWLSSIWLLNTGLVISLYSTGLSQENLPISSAKTANLRQLTGVLSEKSVSYLQTNPHTVSSLSYSQSRFLSSGSNILAATSYWKNENIVNILSPMNLLQSSMQKQYFSPSKILRSLESFFSVSVQKPIKRKSIVKSIPKIAHRVARVSSHRLFMVFDHNQERYEIWINHKFVAYIPDEFAINLFKQRLTQLAELPELDGTQLRPAIVNKMPSVMIGNQFVFGVSEHTSRQLNLSADLLAIEWVNNLRIALKAPPLSLAELQMEMYGLVPSDVGFSGTASWYGDDFDGKLTANGEIYHQKEFTVAHRSLPFNTYLLVRNLLNGNSVIVRVNDRGPYIPPRSLDLSTQAAISIRSETTGVVPYEAIILKPNPHKKSFLPKNEQPVDNKFVDFN